MKSVAGLDQLLLGKQLLIFDFDGTVADTTPLHAAAFAQVLAPLGVTVNYSTIAGLNTLDAMQQCLAADNQSLSDAEMAALVSAKQQCVRQMIASGLEPLPGVDAFLRWAKPRFRMAMVTSGSRGTVSLALEKLGYTGLFDPLVCADDVTRSKPDPEGFLKVLQITGISADAALVFEDSEAGFSAAAAAGLDFVDARLNPWQESEGALT
jgi:HAD superfamily hydrolase (TIGR01509 family)